VSVAASPQPPTTGAAGGPPAQGESSPQGRAAPATAAVAGSPTASAAATSGVAPPAPVGDGCPLCGAPLYPDQEWCLRCGAAARTRLSASPNWKAPIVIVAVVAALSLGVLAAALVKLAGTEGGNTSSATTTVATAPAATAPAASAPAATATTPGAITPGAGTTGATTPGTTSPAGAAPTRTAHGASTGPGVAGVSTSPRIPKLKPAKPLSQAERERISRLLQKSLK
jgi:hypothetical protein